ncbi:HYR domain-containing protein [Maritalea myrionectae]|uniref:HYR domain-containing protein n=1 Tax=Maritalea myrionectae TaxID=454601 RepID=UPI0003F7429C|nr:HYR domain-containing protein [Maritalea myrionectae]
MKRLLHSFALTALVLLASNVFAIQANAQDTTPPRVQSITLYDPISPYSTNNVFTWEVTFTEAVTGVDVADTRVHVYGALSNSMTGSMTQVSPSVYRFTRTVPFASHTVDGEVRMVVSPTHSVTDLAGNPMVDDTVINGEQSTYYYDVNPPDVTLSTSLSSPTDAATVPIEIDFDETVTGFDVSDIQLSGTATSIAGFGGSQDAYWANVVLSGEGPYSISIPASRANDFAGNANNASNVLSGVRDLTAPVINIPTQIIQSTDPGQDTAIVTFSHSANDAVDGPVATTVSTSPTTGLESGDAFPLGTTTVTVRAEDTVGNVSTESFDITIVDTELPVVTSISDIVTTTDPGEDTAVVTFSVGATDNVDGVLPVTITTSPTTGLDSGSAFPIGTTQVQAYAEDSVGNSFTEVFKVTVNDDENPVFTSTQSDITIDVPFNENSAIVTYPMPTATDNSGSVTITRTSGLASGSAFPVGTTTVTHQAEDDAGNKVLQSFNVIVGNTPPATLEFEINSNADGNVSLSSSEPNLNHMINVTGGYGSTGQFHIHPSTYSANYVPSTGFVITNASCDNPAVQIDLRTKTIALNLASGQTIVCTLSMSDSAGETAKQVQNFIDGRARQIVGNQPRQSRRLARVQGTAPQPGGLNVLGYKAPDSGHLPVGVSVANDAIEVNYPTSQEEGLAKGWDAWAEATFSRFETDFDEGSFATLHMGVDYLITPTSILGIGASIDYTHADVIGSTAYTNGLGFMVGPYYTGEISENLYLDISAKLGRSYNNIATVGTTEDQFGATRGLFNASLFGEVELDQLTVRPDVSLNYFYERTDAFVNSFGVSIAEQETRLGDLTFGTTFAWAQPLDNNWTMTPYVTLDGIWTFDSAAANGASTIGQHLRAKTEFGFTLKGDANQSLDFSLAYDGIGDPNYRALSAKFGLSVGF